MSPEPVRPPRADAPRPGDPARPGVPARAGAAGRGVLFLLAIAAGATIPVQARLNGGLAERAGDPTLAAVVSFTAGLLLIAAIALATPWGRRSLTAVRPALADGRVRWWYLLAGMVGGSMVLTQALTVGVIGVAVFTVAVVAGQLIGGMTVDRLGLTPAGVRTLTPRRIAGAVLALASVALVVGPQLADARGGPLWLLVALAPLAVGLATSGQQALNARQAAAYGSIVPVTLINFVAGASALAVVHLAAVAVRGGGGVLPGPEHWWLYLGGPLGCLFIAVSAYLVPRVGAFLALLGLVCGKLLGSLAVDALAPAGGAGVTALTLVGTAGALAAAVLAAGGSRRSGPRPQLSR